MTVNGGLSLAAGSNKSAGFPSISIVVQGMDGSHREFLHSPNIACGLALYRKRCFVAQDSPHPSSRNPAYKRYGLLTTDYRLVRILFFHRWLTKVSRSWKFSSRRIGFKSA